MLKKSIIFTVLFFGLARNVLSQGSFNVGGVRKSPGYGNNSIVLLLAIFVVLIIIIHSIYKIAKLSSKRKSRSRRK